MMLKTVVFPAPFGPINPTNSPRPTEKLTSLSANTPPNRALTPTTCSNASAPIAAILSVLRTDQKIVRFICRGCDDGPPGPQSHHQTLAEAQQMEIAVISVPLRFLQRTIRLVALCDFLRVYEARRDKSTI